MFDPKLLAAHIIGQGSASPKMFEIDGRHRAIEPLRCEIRKLDGMAGFQGPAAYMVGDGAGERSRLGMIEDNENVHGDDRYFGAKARLHRIKLRLATCAR